MSSEGIQSNPPLGPKDQKMYEQEYKQGADLFKRALDQYTKSDNPYQKQEFQDVMDKAMHILNQTAHALMKKELEKQNAEIQKDYGTFKKYPADPDTIKKLNQDLDQAKRSL